MTSSRMGKILVTGGAGYIGSVVARQMLDQGYDVTVVDNLSTGHRASVPSDALFVDCDVAEVHEVLDSSYDAVFHLAASAEVAESVLRPEKYWRNNVIEAFYLLRAMRRSNVKRLVVSSSCAVYGEASGTHLSVDSPTRPINAYGASKLAVDHMIHHECEAHGLAAVSLRYFNVAGSYRDLGERHSPESHLIPLVLQVALGVRERIAVHGNDYPTPDGTCVRDYVHVADIANGHALALSSLVSGGHKVYNLGNGNGFSVRQVIEAAREVTGSPIPEVTGPRRGGDPPILVASAARAVEELGWRPQYPDLNKMISDAWDFHRKVL
ncbi:UDP-glucose 4-epimerase GalE [Streptomyces sp. 3MP-14]|uniref:UDP-glucose 4-epimerase n=1 Tax=Streptomyces mimosae TaxID=2586635 RepID=A0A5N6AC82_9ACTN|nr:MULTISPECIES: UDP-glucose 4-epimerase GalE [Streptomyces]KAB8166424.1 UDP-glucose 4-epimerase GalE [Streptomyces mimosae]KAB8174217.1 UDP-glucose 4-epimerase GalE [Streptomyces sp. 3MP-14]